MHLTVPVTVLALPCHPQGSQGLMGNRIKTITCQLYAKLTPQPPGTMRLCTLQTTWTPLHATNLSASPVVYQQYPLLQHTHSITNRLGPSPLHMVPVVTAHHHQEHPCYSKPHQPTPSNIQRQTLNVKEKQTLRWEVNCYCQ
jgi:hypothetical protein